MWLGSGVTSSKRGVATDRESAPPIDFNRPELTMRLSKLVRIGVVTCLMAAGAVALTVVWKIYVFEKESLVAPRSELQFALDTVGVPGLHEVSIAGPAGSETVAGWYLAPRNGTVVLLAHGSGADRSSMIPEIRILAAAGIGVLAVDSPGYGRTAGSAVSDSQARRSLFTAIDWLARQPGIDRSRIGAIGFSLGGYRLAQVAAVDQRISRVVLMGVPPDGAAVTYYFYRHWTPIAGWIALRIDRALGSEPDVGTPREVIGRIAPRRILFIDGDRDTTVPLEMAQELYSYANEPKEFFVVRGASHGSYAKVAPLEYAARLVQFFGGASAGASEAATAK